MAYRRAPEASHTAPLPRPPPPRHPRPNYSNYSPPTSLVIPPSPSPNKSQSTPLPTSRTRKQPLPPHPTVRTSPPSIAAVMSASPTTSPSSSPRLVPRSRRMSTSYSSPTTTSTPVSPVGSVGSTGSPRPSPSKSKRHPDNIIAHPRVNQRFRYFPKVAVPGILTQPPSRMVGFAENGDVKGVPAFVIGGHGCSRLVSVMFDELGKRYGVRMIWPERPG
ncbi:hypothetical protein BC937DRAFT_90005 [Endogone sp. FLAS-F59071]|nr:hypothetical protein BC937DRAFT_90005 [Endogone sp. FLAS-F59071]|eukprot:RUS17416.1 hypothetical protein BC937DRAFT_90005 [Endogone sp. FLAS-F59071]